VVAGDNFHTLPEMDLKENFKGKELKRRKGENREEKKRREMSRLGGGGETMKVEKWESNNGDGWRGEEQRRGKLV